jgi:hypothetical protein
LCYSAAKAAAASPGGERVLLNFVFVSPHFPANYYLFCRALKNNGVNVLGIADTPYDSLPWELKEALSDYYQVPNLEDGDAMLRAVGWFTHKWGKIDWLESNNEYWLGQDAWLRTMFHIETGPMLEHMAVFKRKSRMKAVYAQAGVKTAPGELVSTRERALAFAAAYGYPLIAKPDDGVGAQGVYKLYNQHDLDRFFDKQPYDPYLLEVFVKGQVCSYDAIYDSHGTPLYETGNITLTSLVDVVNEQLESAFMLLSEPPQDVLEAGRKTAAAFGVKSRMIHFEFFRLLEDQEGLGKAGDLLGLEVNMRPSGGVSPDMMNYAGSVDVYKLWADMVCHDRVWLEEGRRTFISAFVGRRDNRTYKLDHSDIMARYGHRIVQQERIPKALSGAMGDYFYIAQCLDRAEADAFVDAVSERS